MLKIEHLNKRFGEKEVLRDLNLEIPDGTVFGLVGINGAGKSTLLRLISGVYPPDSGSVIYEGMDTGRNPEIRSLIAFVSDEQYFPIGATIASMKTLYKAMYPFDEEAFETYCGVFELDPSMTVANLSKGMKRRVSLLFALAVHPKLLLLDEAYDGLEPLARLRFKKILADLIVDEQITVIISSHNLKELEDICDSFGILDGGRIISYGDLLSSREMLNKYQVAFENEVTREAFEGLELLHFEHEGRVCRLVIRGDREDVTEKLNAMHPVILDVLQTDFEELFIYELESRGETV